MLILLSRLQKSSTCTVDSTIMKHLEHHYICSDSKLLDDTCTTGDLRLEGSNDISKGRVEICYENLWGTICDDYWDSTSAGVVCKQLGFFLTGNQSSTCAITITIDTK